MKSKSLKLKPASIKTLEKDRIYQYPIFISAGNKYYTRLIDIGKKFDNIVENKIIQENIQKIYIRFDDIESYQNDLQNFIGKTLKDKNVTSDVKSSIIHELSSNVVNDLLEGDISPKKIKDVKDVVNNTIDLILLDENAIHSMLQVTSYDYYTYTHSVDVSTYALGFGAYLGYDKEALYILGMAGMMHDLGKKRIDSAIVNKNGRLTDEEFEEIKKHSSYGVDILKEMKVENKTILKIVEQHHEKLDGSGYPNNLKGQEIHIYSQIIAIADIYNALTTRRSYKDALEPFEAFNIMGNHMQDGLNEELLKKFFRFIGTNL